MFFVLILMALTNGISVLSFNQPKLCPTAQWNSKGSTLFFMSDMFTKYPILFIDSNNTIYSVSEKEHEILISFKDRIHSTSIRYSFMSVLSAIFVTMNGDIYTSYQNTIISKWIASTKKFVTVMNAESVCSDLFVDLNNDLYCSMTEENKIVKRVLNKNNEVDLTIVAGSNTAGSASHQLLLPRGIFVDTNLDLYVADCYNHRIQLFNLNEKHGKTVAGQSSTDITISLYHPCSVIVDSDKYLFISFYLRHHIVGSGPNGFRCISGCDGEGIQSSAAKIPSKLSFDISGNLFFRDGTDRLMKFTLEKNSCEYLPSTIQAMYSSILTNNQRFSRTLFDHPFYYYETIEITVSKNDLYIIIGNSSIDLYGHVYKDHFERFNPAGNLIAWYGKCCNKDQFKFTLDLKINTKYILVVTTYNPNVTGPFTITIFGLNTIRLQHMNVEVVVESIYSSALTQAHPKYDYRSCEDASESFYEAVQVEVNESGFYTILSSSSSSNMHLSNYVYEHNFNPRMEFGNLLTNRNNGCNGNPSKITIKLMTGIRYILVVTTCIEYQTGKFSIKILGKSNASFQRVDASPITNSSYSSNLTNANQKFPRFCGSSGYYYYETVRLTVLTNGVYTFLNDPQLNLMPFYRHICDSKAGLTVKLRAGTTYIIVVTPIMPLYEVEFQVLAYGPTNVIFERFVDNSTYCYIGGPCDAQVKSIGLTLDDILRDQINRNMTINHQPFLIKISVAITTLILIAGIISSACSLLTFQNRSLRQTGCGLYLLASSITSLLTTIMFTIKFWFVLLTQMSISVHLSILQGGCKSIETLLKLFFYWDAWLNACIAVERAITVYHGVNFNKAKSKRYARWIIFILPFCIMATIIHEPLYRQIFTYDMRNVMLIESMTDDIAETIEDRNTWCTTSYSQSIQDYNTGSLFVHLLGPFITNFLSALFIITRSARRRVEVQKQQTYKAHIREQWQEHKQLVISPTILLFLSTPRLVISLLSGCIQLSDHVWLYLSAYFISFLPSILIFIVYVIPSTLYRNTFKNSRLKICQRPRS
ncbi:unnamed protein product [Adineta ricciae]|uniref:G-protein coupled receptors family 1 profile domain-containing protein n=1 Tax=Adineta ricciae TaxID=249248 RepID=A0A815VQ43_ADIRI|nr:unnamed protein product [Adineta ricciae]